MAIADIFGPTPEELEYQRGQERENRSRQEYLAKLPNYGSEFGRYAGVARAGLETGEKLRGLRLFGESPSPDMERATVMKQILKTYQGQDMSNPDVMAKMSQELGQSGYPREAMQLMEQAKATVATRMKAEQASEQAKFDRSKEVLGMEKTQADIDKIRKEAEGGQGDTLTEGTITKTIGLVNRVETGMRLADTFEDTFSGPTRPRSLAVAKKMLDSNPSEETQKYFNWWMDYDTYTSEIRAELFGATLTDNEASEFTKIKIVETDSPAIARGKLINQSKWARQGLLKLIESYKLSGYNTRGLEKSLESSTKYLKAIGADDSPPVPSDQDDVWTVEEVPE